MRIAHVVTYTSHDGAFGGPTRVAVAQSESLVRLGHEVTIYAGAPAAEAGDTVNNGVRVRTFPMKKVAPFGGFATMWPVGLGRALGMQSSSLDIAHIHLARDLTTLPAALRMYAAGVPYVVQTHGMIDRSDKRSAAVLDLLATRRALANARTWLTLAADEAQSLSALAAPRRVTAIHNGVQRGEVPSLAGRPDLILFLARMHKRKRPLAFVEMAKKLAPHMPQTEFLMIGPDEGEGTALKREISRAGLGDRLKWIGPVPPSETSEYMRRARVYVLPSENEVFPMSILEAFAAGTPVVATSSLAIAQKCSSYGAALVTDGSIEELCRAAKDVLENHDLANSIRQGASTYMSEELDIDAIARQLQDQYRMAAEDKRHSKSGFAK